MRRPLIAAVLCLLPVAALSQDLALDTSPATGLDDTQAARRALGPAAAQFVDQRPAFPVWGNASQTGVLLFTAPKPVQRGLCSLRILRVNLLHDPLPAGAGTTRALNYSWGQVYRVVPGVAAPETAAARAACAGLKPVRDLFYSYDYGGDGGFTAPSPEAAGRAVALLNRASDAARRRQTLPLKCIEDGGKARCAKPREVLAGLASSDIQRVMPCEPDQPGKACLLVDVRTVSEFSHSSWWVVFVTDPAKPQDLGSVTLRFFVEPVI